MRERPGAPLWPKGRPCADGSVREESRKTHSPPSFRRGKTRPAALTQPMICVPTGKPVGATLAGSLTREVRMPPLPMPSLPQGHAFQPWGRRSRNRPLCARAGVPLWDAGPDVVLSVILSGWGPSPPDSTYASPKTRLAAPFRTPPRRVTRRAMFSSRAGAVPPPTDGMRPDNLIGFVGRLFVESDHITAGHQPPDPVMGDQPADFAPGVAVK